MIKWIAALIGFQFARFPGAVLGFFIGVMIENYLLASKPRPQARRRAAYGPFSGQPQRVSLGDFELNLLSLSAIIIKADGAVSQRELDYVRAHFVRTFGKERANATFRTFNEVVKSRSIDAARICTYLRARTSYEMRLQILHFLFGIADADGKIMDSELSALQWIARYLNLGLRDFESIKAMFIKSADESYKILEIDRDATEAEIKRAYREMVKKYHPDKLTQMDEAYRKGAREKFDKVQEAYDKIRKERGF